MSRLKQDIAYSYGVTAFKNGMPRIPALDSKLLKDCIAGCQVGEGLPYLMAWLKGWDEGNLHVEHEMKYTEAIADGQG